METNRYFARILKERNKQEILAGFDAVMAKIPNREVPDWDKRE